MKYRFYSITLLLILLINICRFQIPYLEYDIFQVYIAQNLCINKNVPDSCCHGKCFLEKQIKLTNETSEATADTSKKVAQNNDVKEFLSSHVIIPKAIELTLHPLISTETVFTSKMASDIFVPPKS